MVSRSSFDRPGAPVVLLPSGMASSAAAASFVLHCWRSLTTSCSRARSSAPARWRAVRGRSLSAETAASAAVSAISAVAAAT
eukprot:537411-Prymnesium_polylepis.1